MIFAAGLLVLAGCEKQPEQEQARIVITPPAIATNAVPPIANHTASPASQKPFDAMSARFQALGTEPFWSVEVLIGRMIYKGPENQEGTSFVSTYEISDNGRVFSGTLDGAAAKLVISQGQCSDGMSDTVYHYKASFTWGKKTLNGCARAK